MAEQPPRMTAQQVLTRIARGELLTFVDARQEKAWASSPSKLPGAFRVALTMAAAGWPEVYALSGGYDAWEQAHGPLESK